MSRPTLDVHLTEHDLTAALRHDVAEGLSAERKTLPSKWFYDARGSELFTQITYLPEYYPTRAEQDILATRAPDIVRLTRPKTLVELGSGTSYKTRLLLDAFRAYGSLARFVPLDVSADALRAATESIAQEYPDLEVHGVVGDFTQHLTKLPGGDGRLVAFLGGTIGNLTPSERSVFFHWLRETLSLGEWMLLGTDLVKDTETLLAAYDDSAGVTAEFNRNVLHVVNRELGADFDPYAFDHVVTWDAEAEWIEMRLRATRAMTVRVRELDMTVEFADGEELRTEISAKFRKEGLDAELAANGFRTIRCWTDTEGRFAVTLAQAG